MHVAVVLILGSGRLRLEGGGLDIDRIRDGVSASLHRIPRYRQKLVYAPLTGNPLWVDDPDFNIFYHVRHTSLPKPGSIRRLKRLAGRIMSQRLDRDKPLWEMWVVEGLEDDRFAIITKAHHCMVDGIAGVDVLATLLSDTPETYVEEAPRWLPRPIPGTRGLLQQEIMHQASKPVRLLQQACAASREPLGAVRALRDSAGAIGETLVAGLKPASPTPINPSAIGPHRRFDWARFNLDDVKEIKNRLGGTVNDVVLTTVTGAMRIFLERRGIQAEALDFRAMLPVNVRPADERGKLGNYVASLLASLPIAERDPRRRMHRVIDVTRELKESRQAQGVELIEAISNWMTPTLISQVVRLAARTLAYNLVVTNVPGPSVPLYFLGAPLLETYPMVPLFTNQALGLALFSYHGGLYWGLNADWDLVPDLHELAQGLHIEFEQLRKAVQADPG